MARAGRNCASLKADGGRCKNLAATGSDYCPAHDPARAEARKVAAARGGSRGGRGRAGASGEIAEIKRYLRRVMDVAPGSESVKGFSIGVQAANVYLRTLSEEREQHFAGELEERLRATEKALEESKVRGHSA